MARLPRVCLPGIPLHVIQRGNNRQVCFGSDDDIATYAQWLEQFSKEAQIAVHAWVFMTNHVHLLVTPETPDGVSRMMQALGRNYVRYFNRTYRRTGTLLEGRFKSCLVDTEGYFLTCQRYIELNPVRAGMVVSPEGYPWSSYQANGLGRPAKLWTPHPVYKALGESKEERTAAYRSLFDTHLESTTLKDIREATQTGMALGNERFKAQIEQLSGRRMVPLKRGPKVSASRRASFCSDP